MNKLRQMIKIASIHSEKILSATRKIQHLFPIDTESFENFSETEQLWIELLIHRFGKLQDLLGSKIIKEFLTEMGEIVDNRTLLDMVHRCEQIGVIKDAELWKLMRYARNNTAHEYPDNPELVVRHLNELFDLTPQLLAIHNNIKEKALGK